MSFQSKGQKVFRLPSKLRWFSETSSRKGRRLSGGRFQPRRGALVALSFENNNKTEALFTINNQLRHNLRQVDIELLS